MNPTPTPTHARIIPTMTPTLAQIDVAQRLARAYSHAWACPEGDEVVERWRAAGAVPATWREEMHAAVEPTCGPIAGITAPSYQPLFTTRGGTLLEEQGLGREWERIQHGETYLLGMEIPRRYVTVDDYHFLCAGEDGSRLDSFFSTDEDGRRLDREQEGEQSAPRVADD